MVSLWGRPWTRRELLARVGVYQRYQRATFPHRITWRQLGMGTYVVAMEPSTNRDAGRLDARAGGELQHLSSDAERHCPLEIGALAGTQDMDAFAERIAVQAGISRPGVMP